MCQSRAPRIKSNPVSYAYFSTQKTELETFSAQVLRLDQALAEYGPETKPLRDKIKAGIEKGYETFWGGGGGDREALSVAVPLANARAVSDFLGTLKPTTDAQKQALATANTYNGMVEQSRLLMSLQVASLPVSPLMIAILVFWTVALFFAIGLFAESNSLVIAALAFGAVSIAGWRREDRWSCLPVIANQEDRIKTIFQHQPKTRRIILQYIEACWARTKYIASLT